MARGWKAEVKRYGVPVAFLAAVTIAVLLVREGLQTKSTPSTTGTATTARTTTRTGTTTGGPRFYRLRSGETLSDVALRFGITVDALLTLNPGVEPTSLTIGQRIRVR
jgi:LysM repeat protein